MPPFPPKANTVKIEALYTGPNGTKAANIMYALMGAGWTPTVANLATVATNFVNSFEFLTNMSTAWGLASVVVTDNGGTTENASTNNVGIPGHVSGNCLPPNCASGVSWTIPAHYRGGHPRTYLPGVPETALTAPGNQSLSSTFRSALASAAGLLLSQFAGMLVSGAAGALGTLAHKRNGLLLPDPTFYPYTGGSIHGRLDSQRRRLGKESLFP